jgi:hypothetical protein
MFDQLFFRSDALTRQLSAPLVEERRQYLALCAAQGMSKGTLEVKARLLLSIAEYLRLADRPNDRISLPEIKKAATRWSNHNWRVAAPLTLETQGGLPFAFLFLAKGGAFSSLGDIR